MKKGKLTFLKPEEVREGDFIWLPRGVRVGLGTLRKNGLSISEYRRVGRYGNTCSDLTARVLSDYRSGPLLMYVYRNAMDRSMPSQEEIDAWRESFDGTVDTKPIAKKEQLGCVFMTCVPIEASAFGRFDAYVASYLGRNIFDDTKIGRNAVNEIEREAYACSGRTGTLTPMLNLTEDGKTLDRICSLTGRLSPSRAYATFNDLNVASARNTDCEGTTLVDVVCSTLPDPWNLDGCPNLCTNVYPAGMNLRYVPLSFLKYVAARHDAKFIRAGGTARAFADYFLATSYRNYAEAVAEVDGLLSENLGKIRECAKLIHRQAEKAKAFAERKKGGTSSYDGLVRMIVEGATNA